MKTIDIGQKTIGKGAPCFIIAELGINHNGDMDLAKKMIDAAIASGADAVKFQNYITEDFIKDKSLTLTYKSQGKTVTESQYDLFKRCELTREELYELNKYTLDQQTIFMSTPTSASTLEDLVAIQVPLLKNGSDFLRNHDLITMMAHTGIPTILSTGMSTVKEIYNAVETFYSSGGTKLCLLHCTSTYPAKAQDVHLRKIQSLDMAFDMPIGFSDHTEGCVASISSVALGATIIEKHFTLTRELAGPDHWFSSEPTEFKELVDGVRYAEKAFGSSVLGYTKAEQEGRDNYTLSCVAGKNLEKNHTLKASEIYYSRPGHGIPPEHKQYLIGRRLVNNVKQGEVFTLEDFA